MISHQPPTKRLALLFLGTALLTIAAGTIHGRVSGRWQPKHEAMRLASMLENLPSSVGTWHAQGENEMPRNITDMLQCTAYRFRTYRHETTGKTVQMSVILGPAGPTSVHIPEICFSSQDYTVDADRERETLSYTSPEGNRKADLWSLTLTANDTSKHKRRVFYAWSTGDEWTAPNAPRLHFAGQPFLYKIQLTSRLPAGSDPEIADPCRDFLHALLPAMDECIDTFEGSQQLDSLPVGDPQATIEN